MFVTKSKGTFCWCSFKKLLYLSYSSTKKIRMEGNEREKIAEVDSKLAGKTRSIKSENRERK
jgi:hypothetical protein